MIRGVLYLAASALFCADFMFPPNAAAPTRTTAELGRSFTAAVWRSSSGVRALVTSLLTGVAVFGWSATFGWAAWSAALAPLEIIAVALFICGYGLRVWSKATLGRHFTYEIQSPEALVSDGPYALLLHPSYTGFALEWGCLGAFWLELPLGPGYALPLAVPLLAAFYGAMLAFLWVWRAQGEEGAMRGAFGGQWDRHVSAGRWRFIPWVF